MTVAQRRGRRIMMTDAERDAYLAGQRTCRVATVSQDGMPHVGALWFVWDGSSVRLYALIRSLRRAQLRRDPRIAVVVDDGAEYGELRGVELTGEVSFVGETPAGARAAWSWSPRSGCSPRSTSVSSPCRTMNGTAGSG